MLLNAAADHGIDLSGSFMVGDALTDMEAGRRAGASSILVRTGRGEEQAKSSSLSTFETVADLSAAVDYITGKLSGN